MWLTWRRECFRRQAWCSTSLATARFSQLTGKHPSHETPGACAGWGSLRQPRAGQRTALAKLSAYPTSTPLMEDSSFVVVEAEQDQAAVLSCLTEFFPSLNSSGDFSSWNLDRQLQVSQQRQRRPDGRLFIDELLSLVRIQGQPANSLTLTPVQQLILDSPSCRLICLPAYLSCQPAQTTV